MSARGDVNILVINCGSSTLKFQVLEVPADSVGAGGYRKKAHGLVDRVGGLASVEFDSVHGGDVRERIEVLDHGEAARSVLAWVQSPGVLQSDGIAAVGHRVVHGGNRFVRPTLIDDVVMRALESVTTLAPLHNGPALSAIRSARHLLGADVPMVAVFDTAFHSGLPDHASRYAIPFELADRHSIRRYGFHGIAHRYMTERYAAITSRPMDEVKTITLQLGNGCSVAAVAAGRSVDTSMGLTPLEGLVMGTRCGDADPSLAGFLSRREKIDVQDVEDWLNTRSGLLGVSGRSQDMRELLDAERGGDPRAALAVEMFCYRVRKYVGAYLAVLGGADAIIFGGGIGENAPEVRARICSGMAWCGIEVDPDRNNRAAGTEAIVSTTGSLIKVHVVPVDEAAIIGEDTLRCLGWQLGGDGFAANQIQNGGEGGGP
jgi:acetate kinase